jgi:hypothetical protein
MSRTFAAAATAVWLVLATLPGQAKENPDADFDLGIVVALLPEDAAGAKAYFAKQAPETQHVLKAGCDDYLKHPADGVMPQTIRFCQFILAK